jgi:bacteriorhodopsin
MLYESAYFSVIIQFITGIISNYGLTLNIPKEKNIFKDLLKVEISVQVIEFIFYIWMIHNLDKIKNITPYRYMDWLLTTPLMLITMMAYLDENNKGNLFEYIKNNKGIITQVVILNIAMLLLGLLGELNYLNYNLAIILGFIPFLYYFKIIYDKYMKRKVSKDKVKMFWSFFILWTLYGVVAFLPYEQKNTAYNILDLFSKNLFGLFLVYVLWQFRQK